MMTVMIDAPDNCLRSASKYFDLNFMDEWFDDPRVKEMVKSIDSTDVLNANMSVSPVLGGIPNQWLSGGVKGLILILKDADKRVFSSTIFGGNCVPWLAQLSEEVDFTLVMEHALELNVDAPINAQAPDKMPLQTQREVWGWYVDNSASNNQAG